MQVQLGAPLAPLTTLGLGGPAAQLVTATNELEIVAVLRETAGPMLVLGGGSNLVVADEGIPGTVLRIASRGLRFVPDDDGVTVEAAAGEGWDELVARCVDEGFAGVECLAGIPGLVGASPVQNVGAYGQEVALSVTAVRAYDRHTQQVVVLTDCWFGYRTSRFKVEAERWVILAVTFRLRRDPRSDPIRYAELAGALGVAIGDSAPLAQVREVVLALRRAKGMVLDPADPDSRSVGSFFTNPVLGRAQQDALRERGIDPPTHPSTGGRAKVSAAWLIEQAGFSRGAFAGPVGISGKHTLALVHRGGGCTADVLRVADEIRRGVHAAFGIALEAEPTLVGVELSPLP